LASTSFALGGAAGVGMPQEAARRPADAASTMNLRASLALHHL